jgi:hypothetical protein
MPKASIFFLFAFFFYMAGCTSTQHLQSDSEFTSINSSAPPKRPDLHDLHSRFQQFKKGDTSSIYEIKLCADVPYDKNPSKVVYKKEPGHVFLIFSQSVSDDVSVSQVFGYYPVRPATVIFGKNVKSQVRDNSGRIYNAEISTKVSRELFFALLDSSIILAARKYNLNKFNCYDYGLGIFNRAASTQILPVQYVKFPFIWGRGGSPTGLYAQLKLLEENDSFWAPHIQFGLLKAPQ